MLLSGKVNGKALELFEHAKPGINEWLKFTTNKKKHNQYWFLQHMKPYDDNHGYAYVGSNYGYGKNDFDKTNGFEVLVVDTSTCNSYWCKVSTARPHDVSNYDYQIWKVVGDQLVSKFLHEITVATFGVLEDVGPVVFINQENIVPVAFAGVYVDYTSTSPTFDSLLQGMIIH